jgi:hypothetical protein
MSTSSDEMMALVDDEDATPAVGGGGGLQALSDDPAAAAAFASMARSSQQARAALQRAREQIVSRKYNRALPWFSISEALSRPTRTGALGEVMANLGAGIEKPLRERDTFEREQQKELLGIDTQLAGLDQASAKAQLDLAALRAKLRNQAEYSPNDIVVEDGVPRYKSRPDARKAGQAYVPPGQQTTLDMRQESAENKAVGEGMGKQYLAIQQTGLDAPSKLSKLDRLDYLLDGLNTGKLAPTFAQLASIGESFGITLDKNLGPKQAALALSREIALTLRNPAGGAGMPGALSDADREFLVTMTPGLTQSPEGNRLILETARKLAQRDMQVAKIARDYRKKHGTLDEGFYDALEDFANANPLFKRKEQASAGDGLGAAAAAAAPPSEAAPSPPPGAAAEAPYGRAPESWAVDPSDPPPRASPQAEAALRANPGRAAEFLEKYKYLLPEL